jgi:hypothetical protein
MNEKRKHPKKRDEIQPGVGRRSVNLRTSTAWLLPSFVYLTLLLHHAECLAISLGGKLLSRNTAGDTAPKRCDCCHMCRQPIKGVACPHVLNRQRWAARQLLFVVGNLAYLHCHLHYCVGDVIMPARSNSSSWHSLSAMYPWVICRNTTPVYLFCSW